MCVLEGFTNLEVLVSMPSSRKLSGGIYAGGNFTELNLLLDYSGRSMVARKVVKILLDANLKYGYELCDPEFVEFLYEEAVNVLVCDAADGNVFGNFGSVEIDWQNVREGQGELSKLVHTFSTNNASLEVFQMAFKSILKGGRVRMQFSLVSFISCLLKFTLKANDLVFIQEIFATARNAIKALECTDLSDTEKTGLDGMKQPTHQSLRLYLLAARYAGLSNLHNFAYDFYVCAFNIYETQIAFCKLQYNALSLIISNLQTSSCFLAEEYDILKNKCILHTSQMLKYENRSRLTLQLTHLYWHTHIPIQMPALCDGKNVVDLLKKSLKYAGMFIF